MRNPRYIISLSIALLVCVIVASCNEAQKSISRKSAKAVPEVVDSFSLLQLPLDEPALIYNVGKGNLLHPPEDEAIPFYEALDKVGSEVALRNGIDSPNPYAMFTVSKRHRVFGFSLLPEREGYTDKTPRGLVGNWDPYAPGAPQSSRGRDWGVPLCKAPGASIEVSTLDPLMDVEGIEYIDFGFAGFGSGIWESLERISSAGSLRGLMVFRAREMLERRSHTTVPSIRGLVVFVDSIDDLSEFGRAFPELSFLCVSTRDGSIIGDLFKGGVLRDNFPHLQGLKIAQGKYIPGEGWTANMPEARQNPIRFAPSSIPDSLQWLCVDGRLLSTDELIAYDRFAEQVQFETPVRYEHRVRKRDIDIVFSGLGWAGGSARSITRFEFFTAERFWRAGTTGAKK